MAVYTESEWGECSEKSSFRRTEDNQTKSDYVVRDFDEKVLQRVAKEKEMRKLPGKPAWSNDIIIREQT